MEIKQKASLFAVTSAFILACSKFFAGMASGSMAVISSALDSLLDVFMSAMNLLAIKKAAQPADTEHQYGHGKMEDLAALVQSCIIIGTGIFIIYKSINKFIQKETISYSGIDLGIMILSLIFSFFISRTLKKTGDRTESNTLKADALHYQSDLYSNSAAILAIILTFYTGITFFDLLFAIVTGIIIIVSAIKILTKGVSGLLDTSIPKNVEDKISDIIRNIPYPVVGYHKLRSRLSGNRKYIDFHLLICRIIIIDEAHALATGVESKIKKEIPRIDITIHIEPCPYECDMTENTCVARRHIPGGG